MYSAVQLTPTRTMLSKSCVHNGAHLRITCTLHTSSNNAMLYISHQCVRNTALLATPCIRHYPTETTYDAIHRCHKMACNLSSTLHGYSDAIRYHVMPYNLCSTPDNYGKYRTSTNAYDTGPVTHPVSLAVTCSLPGFWPRPTDTGM